MLVLQDAQAMVEASHRKCRFVTWSNGHSSLTQHQEVVLDARLGSNLLSYRCVAGVLQHRNPSFHSSFHREQNVTDWVVHDKKEEALPFLRMIDQHMLLASVPVQSDFALSIL